MEFSEVIAKRYACKKYDGSAVSDGQLQAILEAGRLAPTAKNIQEQHVYVARTAEALQKIDQIPPCRYGAPVVLVVTSNSGAAFTYPGGSRNSAEEDAAIVATHMMLAATDAGLDSCWVNFFDPQKAAEVLGFPEGEEAVMMLDLGHATEGTGPLANHLSRKEISQTVTYL